MSDLLTVSNLRTYFRLPDGLLRAVDGVDFSVGQGRTLGVVGESGCGKSVTALSVMRLLGSRGEIQPGSVIRFVDQDLVELTDQELRQVRGNEIAMIFQEPMTSLNPVFTIGDQIAESVRLHKGMSRSAARQHAVKMLELVQIPAARQRVNEYPHQMSGGMRQRAMIAMALSCDPRLLIADEPTTALDVTIQAQILELMRELRHCLGMAILLITHDLGVIAEMADDVVVMYGGQVVESGPVKDIFRHPQHPYTEALLHSIPVLGMRQDSRLRVIEGAVPSSFRWPKACRFAPRCDYAFAKCRTEAPPVFDSGYQHSRCWLCESGTRQAQEATRRS